MNDPRLRWGRTDAETRSKWNSNKRSTPERLSRRRRRRRARTGDRCPRGRNTPWRGTSRCRRGGCGRRSGEGRGARRPPRRPGRAEGRRDSSIASMSSRRRRRAPPNWVRKTARPGPAPSTVSSKIKSSPLWRSSERPVDGFWTRRISGRTAVRERSDGSGRRRRAKTPNSRPCRGCRGSALRLRRFRARS